jgi:hypothetical protein
LDQVVQYPFLYKDFTYTSLSDIQLYLASDKGYESVVGTTLGLLPFSMAFAILVGGILGAIGGLTKTAWLRWQTKAQGP